MTLPQELRAARGSFYLESGKSYVATFSATTVKPPDEPGLGMYLGVTFSCVGEDGSEWVGGTENLLRGEPVTYRNHLLLTPEADQVVSCSVHANAPYDDVAAAGPTIDLDIHWRAAEAEGQAVSTPSEDLLPMTVDAEDRAFAFAERISVEDRPVRTVSMLSSLNLTTCRRRGQPWPSFPSRPRVELLADHADDLSCLTPSGVQRAISSYTAAIRPDKARQVRCSTTQSRDWWPRR